MYFWKCTNLLHFVYAVSFRKSATDIPTGIHFPYGIRIYTDPIWYHLTLWQEGRQLMPNEWYWQEGQGTLNSKCHQTVWLWGEPARP